MGFSIEFIISQIRRSIATSPFGTFSDLHAPSLLEAPVGLFLEVLPCFLPTLFVALLYSVSANSGVSSPSGRISVVSLSLARGATSSVLATFLSLSVYSRFVGILTVQAGKGVP